MLNESSQGKTLKELITDMVANNHINMDMAKFDKQYAEELSREYARNEEEIKQKVNSAVYASHNGIEDHHGVIQTLVNKVIKRTYLEEGNVQKALEELNRELSRTKGNGELVYEGIMGKQEAIKSILTQLYSQNPELMENNAFVKLKEAKETINGRWMQKLLNEKTNLNEEVSTEEKQKVEAEWGLDSLDSKTSYRMREGVSEQDAYDVLERVGESELLTYERAEIMFSRMHEPYSKKFKTWFSRNYEEILQRPEAYGILSEIHNVFDTKILENSHFNSMLNNGRLTVDAVLNQYDETRDNLESREGNEELHAYAKVAPRYAGSGNITQEEYDDLQDIFEETKNRVHSYLPTITSQSNEVELGNGRRVSYQGRILRADDPLQLFAGNFADCCQQVGGPGKESMEHGSTTKTGRIFVVEEIDEARNKTYAAISWVWRKGSTMCFDNIEIPKALQRHLRDSTVEEDIKRQNAVLDVYRQVGKEAMKKDQALFDQLLAEGKITQDQYDDFCLKTITVGTGYNDLGVLTTSGLEEVSNPEAPTLEKSYSSIWIDSGGEGSADGSQVIIAGETPRERMKDIISIPVEAMYQNPREVVLANGNEITQMVGKIKRIEDRAYRQEQKMLQGCKTAQDVADIYGIEDAKNLHAYVSRDEDWYMLYEEREGEVYIADMASTAGLRSESKESKDFIIQTLEMREKLYEVLQKAAEEGKTVSLNATEDTSYPIMQYLAKNGIVTIQSDSRRSWNDYDENNEYYDDEYEEEDSFEETDSEENKEEINNEKAPIIMHDMTLNVDAEKVKEELKKTRKALAKRKAREVDR